MNPKRQSEKDGQYYLRPLYFQNFLKVKTAILFAIFLISVPQLFAQVGISATSITPDASSILELRSNTKGFLPSRMTTTERNAIATPATGLFIYNTTTNQLNYYNGSSWQIAGGESVNSAITAAGTTQATATALISDYNIVTTVTASAYGVKLPVPIPGNSVYIVNNGTNTLQVYPASGGSIDGLGVNASYDIQIGGAMEFKASSLTQWFSTSNVVKGKITLTNQVTTTANAYTNVTGLSFQARAGVLYQFKATIIYSSGSTACGSGWAVSGPPSPNLVAYKSNFPLSLGTESGRAGNDYDLPNSSTTGSAFTQGNIAVIQGFIDVSTSGTVTIRFRSETTSGITAEPGSVLEWW